MNLIINGKKRIVVPVSKLTCDQFIEIMIRANVTSLDQYIALFCKISVNELMDAEFKTFSLESLHASLFDIDIENSIKDVPKTVTYSGRTEFVKDLKFETFGKAFMFDLYHGKFTLKKFDMYTLSVYCLAVYFSDSNDDKKIEAIFKDLMKRKWTEIIPAAFFLTKRSLKGRRNSRLMWLIFMWGLKVAKLKRSFRMSSSSIIKRNLRLKR